MRVPYSWLREYCDPGIGAEELAGGVVQTFRLETCADGIKNSGHGLGRAFAEALRVGWS